MKSQSSILLAVLCLAALLCLASPARASDEAEWLQLNGQVRALNDRGAYKDAVELGKRAGEFAERAFGRDDHRTATSLNNLGLSHAGLGQYRESKVLYIESIAIRERIKSPEDREMAVVLHNLGLAYLNLGQYGEALPTFQRARTIAERIMGEGADETLLIASAVAQTLIGLNRGREAEALLLELLELTRRFQPPDAYRKGELHYLLGTYLIASARYGDAEGHLKEALRIVEITIGLDHPSTGNMVGALGLLYGNTGRLPQARTFFDRSRTIFEHHFGTDSPLTATAYHNLAHVLWRLGDRGPALGFYDKALKSFRASLGPEHPSVATVLSDLSVAYQQSGQLDLAMRTIEESVKIRERALHPDHPDLGLAYSNLAYALEAAGRIEAAVDAYRKSIGIYERTFGGAHPNLATPLGGFADLQFKKLGQVPEALHNYRRATAILIERAQREAGATRSLIEIEQHAYIFRNTLDLMWAAGRSGSDPQLREEAYVLSQWAQRTAASLALAQAGARLGTDQPALGRIIRQRQDLVAQWQVVDQRLTVAVGGPKGLDGDALGDSRGKLAEIETTIRTLDEEIKEKFPTYGSLTNAEPLPLELTRQLIGAGEVLVQMAASPAGIYIWAIDGTSVQWTHVDLTEVALQSDVAALRCGLDGTLWTSAATKASCLAQLNGVGPRRESVDGQEVEVLPFDLVRAHTLYARLLAPFESMIKGKHLLVVPTGPLTSLPLHVLVTEVPMARFPAAVAGYRDAAWLATRQTVTVLPSVGSLQSLRRLARSSGASKPYLGIGNPLLDGPQQDPKWGKHWATLAKAARAKQKCPSTWLQRVALAPTRAKAGFDKLFRGGQADIEEVRLWIPLPETADELCEVARRLGVPESEVLLGERATESTLKSLSDSGRLADYRILHFATHGALTGQVIGVAEPGLILTPPTAGTLEATALQRDDGFLTSSEIASLKLDADWVILSACNTASGDASQNAEVLSGMARAFFYAGARSLLVSHWEVQSHAAVKLTTAAFAYMRSHPAAGRAEALRHSMRELIEKGSPLEAHPNQWAPFAIVGEGAR